MKTSIWKKLRWGFSMIEIVLLAPFVLYEMYFGEKDDRGQPRSKTGFQDMGPDAVRRSGDVTVAMREVAVGTVECAISRPGKERVVRARLLVTVKDTLDCGSDPYWDAAARSAISEADNLDQSWGGAAEWEKSKGREDVDDRWRVTR